MFAQTMPALSKGRRVIAVDLQAHGRTADIDRPLSLEAMADDIAALAQHLKITKADVMGYSMSGGVALHGGAKKDGGWDGSGVSTAQLAFLPGLTHYNVFSSPVLPATVTPFLDAPLPSTPGK
jgi:pimeloyl-ACP methyl ester carboxylesterase